MGATASYGLRGAEKSRNRHPIPVLSTLFMVLYVSCVFWVTLLHWELLFFFLVQIEFLRFADLQWEPLLFPLNQK